MKSAGVVFVALLIASSGFAADEAVKRTIQVRGTGTVSAAPDRVSFVAGVESDSTALKEAYGENKRIVAAVLKALRDRGVTDAQMRTANFSIQMGGDERQVKHYIVMNSVTVTRDKIDDVADLIGAAVDAGANNVSSVSYSISNASALRDASLDRAYADARARAQRLAAAAGKTLGEPLDISTEGIYGPPVLTEAITVGGGGSNLELQAGMREVTSTVLVTFELK